MRRLAALTIERLVAHVESLPRQPSADVDGAADLARSLREELPEDGAPYESLLALLFDRAIPKSFNTAGPMGVALQGEYSYRPNMPLQYATHRCEHRVSEPIGSRIAVFPSTSFN